MVTTVSAALLSQFSVSDQFDHPIDWNALNAVPRVIVVAGKKAAPEAKAWGIFLQEHFNAKFVPGPRHLQSLDARERVKVVAVATLPEVPGVLRAFFRAGFRKESPHMGVGLDFASRLSRALGYHAENPKPCLALFPANSLQIPAELFCGFKDDATLRSQVESAVSKLLTPVPAPATK